MQARPVTSRRAGLSLVASLGVISTTGLSLGPELAETSESMTAAAPSLNVADEELREMILGRWRTESHGARIVHNRPDGRASMDLTFDFVASLWYGDKMKLELSWAVEKGLLRYTIESGIPQPTVDRMTSTYGKEAIYHFKSIGEKRMHLVRVSDPNESYIWIRVD
jgi:hypothetical protein